MKKLRRSEWLKTPYAKSKAQDADAAIQRLLAKYGVSDIQWTQGKGPNGRPAFQLRFILAARPYRIMLEALDVEDATDEELLRQVKRAIFYYLKSTLEVAQVFITPEEALFAFLELPQEQTMYAAAKPHLDRLTAPDFGRLLLGHKPETAPCTPT